MENPRYFWRFDQVFTTSPAAPEDLQREEADEARGHPGHHLLNGNEEAWLRSIQPLVDVKIVKKIY